MDGGHDDKQSPLEAIAAAARAIAAAPCDHVAETIADEAARLATGTAVVGFPASRVIAQSGTALDPQAVHGVASSPLGHQEQLLALPLTAAGRTFGTLVVSQPRDHWALEILAAQGGLALAAAELARSEREVETRVAMLVHDLKQPMTVLDGVIRTLEARGGDLGPDEGALLLDAARRRGSEVIDLIERVLETTRRGQDRLGAFADLPVEVLVEAATVGVGQLRRLEVGGLPDACVHVEPTAARVALQTLLDNAVRHSPAGSTVRLEGEVDGNAMIVEVRNDTAGASCRSGTGFGLTIAYRLAATLGGRLEYRVEREHVVARLALPLA